MKKSPFAVGLLVPTVCLGVLLASEVAGANWPQFRGPHGSSAVNDPAVPSRLNAESVQWKIQLPGRGLSSPIVIGERVFVTCSSGPRQDRLHVICFSATDGSKRWERQFWATGRTMCHEKTSVAAPSPVSDGERVFAIFSSNDCVAFDLDGNLLWFRGLGKDYPNASNSLGMSSSPVVANGTLIVQVENDSESFAAGLDVRTGTNRWKLDRPKLANWTSPVLIQENQKAWVGLQSGKGFSAVDPVTGSIGWNYSDGAGTVSSSVVSDGVIYVPSHGLTALRPPEGNGAPVQVWRSSPLRPGTPSPLAVANRLFILNDGGILTCGDTATGQRLWQLRLTGPFSATPVAAGGILFCVNENGLAQVIDPSGTEGRVTSELNLGETILSTPAISNGAIYIRSDGRLWKLGKSSTGNI